MKNIINLTVILSMFLSFSSCDKDNDLIPETISDKNPVFSVKNGTLWVKDHNTLDSLIEEMSTLSNENQVAWEEKIGFSSYYSLYNYLFDEYEAIINSAESEDELIQNLDFFIESNDNYIIRPQIEDEGSPDYSIAPSLDTKYNRLANHEGLIMVGDDILDTRNIVKLKSGNIYKEWEESCTKTKNPRGCKHDRKMTVKAMGYEKSYGFDIKYIYVTHKRKVSCIWVGYKTRYYWRYKYDGQSSWNYFDVGYDVSSGTRFSVPYNSTTSLVHNLKVWNRGVGESRSCEF